jgi:hypothetical protein
VGMRMCIETRLSVLELWCCAWIALIHELLSACHNARHESQWDHMLSLMGLRSDRPYAKSVKCRPTRCNYQIRTPISKQGKEQKCSINSAIVNLSHKSTCTFSAVDDARNSPPQKGLLQITTHIAPLTSKSLLGRPTISSSISHRLRPLQPPLPPPAALPVSAPPPLLLRGPRNVQTYARHALSKPLPHECSPPWKSPGRAKKQKAGTFPQGCAMLHIVW